MYVWSCAEQEIRFVGRDCTPDFIRSLEKQGAIVDAYLDSEDITIKGKGIRGQTSYLIVGAVPNFGTRERADERDDGEKQGSQFSSLMAEMREEAIKLGVPVVPPNVS